MEQLETPRGLRERAAEDLWTADTIRKADDEKTVIICYHLEQFVEKSIKSRLMELGIVYGRIHDIRSLILMLPNGEEIDQMFYDDLMALSHYATTMKYSSRVPTVDEMNHAFDVAPKIVELI